MKRKTLFENNELGFREANDPTEEEVSQLVEEQLFEDEESSDEERMSDEDLRIESLKIATGIAKLMSDVTTDDIIAIASKVQGFIRDHNIGGESSQEEKGEGESESEASQDIEDLNFNEPLGTETESGESEEGENNGSEENKE